MSNNIYIYPSGEQWTSFNPVTGSTTSHARGAIHHGMTLRDHFAGLAMQSMVSTDHKFELNDDCIARGAYQIADAMLKERAIAIAKIGVK